MRTKPFIPARHRHILLLGAVALAGVLVGSLLTAWQTDDLPWAASEESVCWDTVRAEDVTEIYGRDYTYEAKPLASQDLSVSGLEDRIEGFCRIQVRATDDARAARKPRSVNVGVHQPDRRHSSSRESKAWYEDFLDPEMVPIGNGVTGMTSRDRSWIALPTSCVDSTPPNGEPVLVNIDATEIPQTYSDIHSRRDLARLNVQVANTVMDALACRWDLSMPDQLPEKPRYGDAKSNAHCGAPGVQVSGESLLKRRQEIVTDLSETARVCGVTKENYRSQVRMITLEDPRLAKLWEYFGRESGQVAFSEHGITVVGGDFAAHQTRQCATGGEESTTSEDQPYTAFLVIDEKVDEGSVAEQILPEYAAAEGERLNCAPFEVPLPD